MNFPEALYTYLQTHTLIEIKGGLERKTFLEIWMVEVNGRLFSRSWNKNKRSWFTEFEKTGVGEIKYGNLVLQVKGIKVPPEDAIHEAINSAYLEKYNQEVNLEYAKGITQPEYAFYTMEFTPR